MALQTQLHNPVFWQEANHQERGVQRWRKRWSWVGYVIVAAVIGLVIATLGDVTFGTRETGMFVIWVIHACAALFAIVAGANVISREHVGATWDALVLTGVSARKIMLGKWYAALRRAAPWLVILGITRLAMLPVFSMALVNRFAWRFTYYNTSYNYNGNDNQMDWSIELIAWSTILAVLGTVLLTALEIMACTALGMATSAVTKRGAFAIVTAAIIRFLPVAMFAGFTLFELKDTPYRAYRWYRYTPFSLADAGTGALYQLVQPAIMWTRGRQIEALPGLLMAIGLLLLILGGSLGVSWAFIRRGGALPEPKKQVEAVSVARPVDSVPQIA